MYTRTEHGLSTPLSSPISTALESVGPKNARNKHVSMFPSVILSFGTHWFGHIYTYLLQPSFSLACLHSEDWKEKVNTHFPCVLSIYDYWGERTRAKETFTNVYFVFVSGWRLVPSWLNDSTDQHISSFLLAWESVSSRHCSYLTAWAKGQMRPTDPSPEITEPLNQCH